MPVVTGAPKLEVSLYRAIPDAVRRDKGDQVGTSARETEAVAGPIGAPRNPGPQEGCGAQNPCGRCPRSWPMVPES